MSLTVRTTLGCTEAILADDGGLNLFYHVAGIINEDSINWDFKYKGHPLTLHYNIYNGISVHPTKTRSALPKENLAVVELANILEGKLFNGTLKNIA